MVHGGPAPTFMSEFLFGLLAYGPDSADPTIDDIVDDEYKQQVQKVFLIDESQMITCMILLYFMPHLIKRCIIFCTCWSFGQYIYMQVDWLIYQLISCLKNHLLDSHQSWYSGTCIPWGVGDSYLIWGHNANVHTIFWTL